MSDRPVYARIALFLTAPLLSTAVVCGIEGERWIVEVGDVQLAAGAERVQVPVFVTTSRVWQDFAIHLDIDQARFVLVPEAPEATAGTLSERDPDVFAIGVGIHEVPAAAIFFDLHLPDEPEKHVPAGVRQHLLNFVFDLSGPSEEGAVFSTAVVESTFGVASIPVTPDRAIGGKIFVGDSGVESVEQLTADVVAPGDAVRLSWRNRDAYDRVLVERNGETVADLDGDATEYIDAGVPDDVFLYKVLGERDGKPSFPRRATVSTFSPSGVFVRGDVNRDAQVDMSDAVKILTFLFLGDGPLDCDDAADANDDSLVDMSDAVELLVFLFHGTTTIAPPTGIPWFDGRPDGLGCEG